MWGRWKKHIKNIYPQKLAPELGWIPKNVFGTWFSTLGTAGYFEVRCSIPNLSQDLEIPGSSLPSLLQESGQLGGCFDHRGHFFSPRLVHGQCLLSDQDCQSLHEGSPGSCDMGLLHARFGPGRFAEDSTDDLETVESSIGDIHWRVRIILANHYNMDDMGNMISWVPLEVSIGRAPTFSADPGPNFFCTSNFQAWGALQQRKQTCIPMAVSICPTWRATAPVPVLPTQRHMPSAHERSLALVSRPWPKGLVSSLAPSKRAAPWIPTTQHEGIYFEVDTPDCEATATGELLKRCRT